MSTANIALGVVALIVVTEHAAIWSLFYRKGWRVSVPASKTATAPAEPESPAGAVVLNVGRGRDGKFQRRAS